MDYYELKKKGVLNVNNKESEKKKSDVEPISPLSGTLKPKFAARVRHQNLPSDSFTITAPVCNRPI